MTAQPPKPLINKTPLERRLIKYQLVLSAFEQGITPYKIGKYLQAKLGLDYPVVSRRVLALRESATSYREKVQGYPICPNCKTNWTVMKNGRQKIKSGLGIQQYKCRRCDAYLSFGNGRGSNNTRRKQDGTGLHDRS